MPSASDLLKKHGDRMKRATDGRPKIKRTGATRPWQENLEQYSDSSLATSAVIDNEASQILDVPRENVTIGSNKSIINDEIPESQDPAHKAPSLDGPVSKKHVPAHNRSMQDKESLGIEEESHSALATKWLGLISKFGFDAAMKFLLVEELADSDRHVRYSQQALASKLKMNPRTIKRVFDELCDLKLIELVREFDRSSKGARQYRIIRADPER